MQESFIRGPSGRAAPAVLLSLLLSPAGPAVAQEADGDHAETASLGLLSRADRDVLAPHLRRGPIALVEFSGDAELPAIILATEISAPAERVAGVIADPTAYPRFMPALDSVQVRSRREGMVAYDWTWRTAVFTLHGSAVMTGLPAPRGRRDRPWRMEIRNTAGDLGTGRQMWRVYPQGPNRSLVVFSSRLDMRDANYVTRQIGRQRSINRTMNLSLAYVMMMGVRAEAHRLAGFTPRGATGDPPPLRRPEVDLRAFGHLLVRGDLVLMDMTGDRLDQIAVIGRLAAPLEPTRDVMTDPRAFGPALIPGSYANVVREEGNEVDFEWGVDIPLVGTSGKMRITDRGERITVDAIEGALRGGQWVFETPVYPWGEVCVIAYGRFDPADANWLIRMLVEGTPGLGHGIQAGTELMVVRAVRSRTQDRVAELAEEQRAEREREGARLEAMPAQDRRSELERRVLAARASSVHVRARHAAIIRAHLERQQRERARAASAAESAAAAHTPQRHLQVRAPAVLRDARLLPPTPARPGALLPPTAL